MGEDEFSYLSEDYEDEESMKLFFPEQVNMKTIKEGYDYSPFFAYQYLDFDTTTYCFNQPHFDNIDITAYFKKVKEYSQIPIGDLIEVSHHKEHFHIIEPIPPRIKEMIKTISGKTKIKDEDLPIVGQFGLYTNANANRNENVKSPRIFFFIGSYSTINILFYDPFHELFNAKTKPLSAYSGESEPPIPMKVSQ
jgi:hypothetical protein